MDYRAEMKKLRDTLNENARLYYTMDASTMSDYEYDQLYRRLQDLEKEHPEEITPDSPTQRVGDAVLNDFAQVEHPVPLESLEDVFDGSEVEDFLHKVLETLPKAEYSVEPKVDGLSVALEYRDGVFYKGATRGDGRVGEDVTENLRTIRSIPMTLPEKLPRLIVRGEVYMARSVFEELNEALELEGKPLMANPRNAAAGSLRQKDPRICAQRRLDIAVFNLQLAEGRAFSTHAETIGYLKSQGFPTIPQTTLSEGDDILREIERLGDTRMSFPFDIDGAVIKLNSLSDREVLGSTAKCPKWAVAYKYPPEKKPSRVVDIVVQVGRTGVLTPKAVLEPVRLAGQMQLCTIWISSGRRTFASVIRSSFRRQERSSLRSSAWCGKSGRMGRRSLSFRIPARCAGRPWLAIRTVRLSAAPARSALHSFCATSFTLPPGMPWISTASARLFCGSLSTQSLSQILRTSTT